MTTIDAELILAELREAGARLCETFWRQEPVLELDEMLTALRRIDGVAMAALRAGLAEAYPRIGWLEGEFDEVEADVLAGRGEYWICDAIDGATQFLRAIPNWSMSLTLIRDGAPVFAAVYDAMHDEMFHALAGGGAYRNDVAMRVSARDSHFHGIVASSQPPCISRQRKAVAQAGHSLSAMLRDVAAARNFGPTSLQLAYVACGRLDAFWEFGADGFNCVGPALLVREAGGVVTQADGAPYVLSAGSIAAAPPKAHASMLLRLRESLGVAQQPATLAA